ncbi:MAG: DUF1499 domain-containing protein [Cypionkella sp.]
MRVIMILAAILIVAVLGLMAYVRLVTVIPGQWNVDIAKLPEVNWTMLPAGADMVVTLPNGAIASLQQTPEQAPAALAKLDAAAIATPRTTRIAGSVQEGRITWETRSLIWGFPDYTTAQITEAGPILIYARQRFGRSDLGVNAAKLKDWLARL